MKIVDDDHVLNSLKSKFFRITPKGNTTYSKALRLFAFYRHLCEFGYDETKRVTSKSSFYDQINFLVEAGLSLGYLQNLEPNKTVSNVVPFLRLVNVDFSAQRPVDYVEPVSRFSQVA
jgi:II/X family phage/plasmid replication protein